jgi:hypothetical protein
VVERPLADAADRDLVDPLLSDLTALRAEKFLDAPLAPEAAAGLAAAVRRIELSVKGKSDPISIELGAFAAPAAPAAVSPAEPDESAPEGNRYVKVAGQAIEAKTKLAEAIARAPEAWRSKAWTGFDSWKVERIKVEDAAGKLELKRDAGDWLRDGVKISYTEVGDLLYALTSARADRLLSGDAAQALSVSSPIETVVFSDANGVEETLTLHAAISGGEGGVAARVSGCGVVLVLPQKTSDEVVAKIATVRAAKAVEETKPAEATKPETEAGIDADAEAIEPEAKASSEPPPAGAP